MTVATSAASVTVQGNGATLDFGFSFVGAIAADMDVWFTDAASTSTLLAPSVYTLTLALPLPGQIWGYGGTVVYPLSGDPITAGESLTIIRSLPYVQEVSISNQGTFYPQATEIALDYEMMCIQQLEEILSRTIKGPPTGGTIGELPPDRAGKCLGFDNNGDPIAVDCAGGTGPPGPPGPGGLLNVRYFKSGSGTYTATVGTSAVIIKMVGAGAGGAGGGNADAAKASLGGGGGGGGYLEKFLTSGFDGVAYAVGAKGTGGSASGGNGVDGGDTTFDTLSAFGGKKGTAQNNFTPSGLLGFTYATGGLGGAATGGDLNVSGETPSSVGMAMTDATNALVLSQAGGSSLMGLGAAAAFASNAAGEASAGNNAAGYGAGGSGAAVGSAASGKAGGDGSGGLLIIYEYA